MRPSGMLCTSLENTRYTWALLTYDLKISPETGSDHYFLGSVPLIYLLFLIICLSKKHCHLKILTYVLTLPSGSHSGTMERNCSSDSGLLQEIQAGKSG